MITEYLARRGSQIRWNDRSYRKASGRRVDSLGRVARARAYQCQRAGSRRVVVDRGSTRCMARNCMGSGCPRSVCVAVKWLGNRSSGIRSPCYPHPGRGAVRGDPIGSPDRSPGRRSTFLASWHSGLSSPGLGNSCWPGHGDSSRDTSLCPPESETHLWACWLSRWRLVFGRIRRSFVDSPWVGTFWESSIW